MTNLRTKLIRLAHEKPELRSEILPILREAKDEPKTAGRFNHTLPREMYIPKDEPTLFLRKNLPEGLEIWTWEAMHGRGTSAQIRPYAVAFAGKSGKPLWYHPFMSINDQEKKIQETIKAYTAGVEAKKQRSDEKKNFDHGLAVGDILVSSWGYDQTNVDWYQVTKVIGKAIGLRSIAGTIVKADGSGSDTVVPAPNHFTGGEMKKIPQKGWSSVRVKIDSSSTAYKWNGKPERATSSGWGH